MSTTNFVLAYERVDNKGSSFYRGNIYREGAVYDDELFNELPFNRMMTRFATLVREAARVGTVLIRRLESPNHPGVPLTELEIETIKSDPAAWIRSMSVPDRQVVVHDRKIETRSVLRVGHDTLADAFGGTVYLKARPPGSFAIAEREVECPLCGRWGRSLESPPELNCACGAVIPGEWSGAWLAVPTELLLSRDGARYYLPRKWNDSGPWISHEDLAARLAAFNKEKADVQQQ